MDAMSLVQILYNNVAISQSPLKDVPKKNNLKVLFYIIGNIITVNIFIGFCLLLIFFFVPSGF